MMTNDEIIGRVLAELPRAIGAVCETSASKRPATSAVQDGFVVTLKGVGDVHGALTLTFDRAGAAALTKVATGSALEPNDTVIGETLKALGGRICGALDPQRPGAAFVVASVAPVSPAPAVPAGSCIDVVVKGVEQVLRVSVDGAIEWTSAGLTPHRGESQTLDVIMDIDLPLVVRFGRTELSLKTLTTLGPGSVIDLGRAPDDPVEVLISNRVVARGEVVIVAGSYGVRVRDVVSPAERARSLEAEFA